MQIVSISGIVVRLREAVNGAEIIKAPDSEADCYWPMSESYRPPIGRRYAKNCHLASGRKGLEAHIFL